MALCWYFSRDVLEQKSPSRKHGISVSAETKFRREGAKLIINASNTLKLRCDTMATGVVFFHRFYIVQSFHEFNHCVVAAACLLLAGKVEETPKKCKDVIKVCRSLLTDAQMAAFGSDPKEELLAHERVLLQTIRFDLQVEHPYAHLLEFAKSLRGDKAKIESVVQMAWTFINDSLCTSLCLQWEPKAVAVAFLYLGGKLSSFDLQAATQSRSRSWWRNFVDTVDIHDLEAICHLVLDVYTEGKDTKPEQKVTEQQQHHQQQQQHYPQQHYQQQEQNQRDLIPPPNKPSQVLPVPAPTPMSLLPSLGVTKSAPKPNIPYLPSVSSHQQTPPAYPMVSTHFSHLQQPATAIATVSDTRTTTLASVPMVRNPQPYPTYLPVAPTQAQQTGTYSNTSPQPPAYRYLGQQWHN